MALRNYHPAAAGQRALPACGSLNCVHTAPVAATTGCLSAFPPLCCRLCFLHEWGEVGGDWWGETTGDVGSGWRCTEIWWGNSLQQSTTALFRFHMLWVSTFRSHLKRHPKIYISDMPHPRANEYHFKAFFICSSQIWRVWAVNERFPTDSGERYEARNISDRLLVSAKKGQHGSRKTYLS